MPTVVGVTLRDSALVFVDADEQELTLGDVVILRSDRGEEVGRISAEAHEIAEGRQLDATRRIARIATPEDLRRVEELRAKERDAMQVYRRLIGEHGLDMKPTRVEYLFDGSRATFYFVVEERVDFRDLVRDLAAELHVRVDMRQIGVRDEARLVGGLGHCGEQLCCVRMGGEFQPVTIRMAKEQDLPLNPLRISGVCGRLMCCLRYESEAYRDFKSRAPKKGALVDIGGDPGKVVELDTPRERVTMRKEDGSRLTFPLTDLDCECDGQCACRVKAEAMERSLASLTSGPGAFGSTSMGARRQERAGHSVAPAPPAASEPAAPPAEPSVRRRRRRRTAPAEQPPAAAAPQAAPAQKRGQPKPPAQPQAGAGSSETSPQPTAHRRRRRRRGGSGGTPSSEA